MHPLLETQANVPVGADERKSPPPQTLGEASIVRIPSGAQPRDGSSGATVGTAELSGPASPYTLSAGTVIPAALVTGVISDLPGPIVASVTEGVYDSVSGRHLLVPQGSRLLGQYDSHVLHGQKRILLVWTQLTLPDG